MTDKIHPAVETVARWLARDRNGFGIDIDALSDSLDLGNWSAAPFWRRYTPEAQEIIRAFLDATREPSMGQIQAGRKIVVDGVVGAPAIWVVMHDQLRKEILG